MSERGRIVRKAWRLVSSWYRECSIHASGEERIALGNAIAAGLMRERRAALRHVAKRTQAARAAAFEEAAALAMSVEPLAPDRRYLNPDDFYVDRGALAEKIAEYKADFGAEMARVFRALAAKERR